MQPNEPVKEKVPGSLCLPIYSPELGFCVVSLEQVLKEDVPGVVAHRNGYLTQPALMMASAVLQVIVDSAGGISMEEWTRVVLDGGKLPAHLVQALETAARTSLAGFDLRGDAPFLQVPAPLVDGIAPSAIDGLFEPVRMRFQTTSKALRMPLRKIGKVCDLCAAVGLYLNHHFTTAKSQYWGTSPVSGAVTALIRFDEERAPSGIRRTLFSNLVFKESRWENPQPLPWIPQTPGLNGLDPLGVPPFERYLCPAETLSAPANVHLPLIRGLRLDEETQASGTCGCCGQPGERLFTRYRVASDKQLFGCLRESTRLDLKKHAGVLSKVLNPDARHPFIGYRLSRDGSSRLPIRLAREMDDARRAEPSWVVLSDFLADMPRSAPLVFPQFNWSVMGLYGTDQLEEAQRQMDVSLFSISFEGGTDPSVRSVFHDRYGLSASALTERSSNRLAEAMKRVQAEINILVKSWIEGALVLDCQVVKTNEGGKETFEVKRGSKRLTKVRERLGGRGIFHTMAAELWENAWGHVSRWLDGPHLLETGDGEANVEEAAAKDLERMADGLWRGYLDKRSLEEPSLEFHYLISRAGKDYWKSKAVLRRKNPSLFPGA